MRQVMDDLHTRSRCTVVARLTNAGRACPILFWPSRGGSILERVHPVISCLLQELYEEFEYTVGTSDSLLRTADFSAGRNPCAEELFW